MACFIIAIFTVVTFLGISNRYNMSNYAPVDREYLRLKSTVKILCIVPTTSRNHIKRARAVLDTWGKRCNKIVFFSDSNKSLKYAVKLNTKEGAEHLTEKMMNAFQFVYKTHGDYDWILKADDDTYVILENLRYMLSKYHQNDPIYFGQSLNLKKDKKYESEISTYMSGGAGYVMSKEALRRLVVKGIEGDVPCWTLGGAEDLAVGRCMTLVGVAAGDSTDLNGIETFHPFNLQSHLSNSYPEWYIDYKGPDIMNKECCSRFTISYHFVDYQMMYIMDHLLYKTSVYGRMGVRPQLN